MSNTAIVRTLSSSISAHNPADVLRLIESARMALHAVEGTPEVIAFTRQADALRYCAQKVQCSADVQNQAAEVALRAKRAAGEFLADCGLSKGGRPLKTSATMAEVFPPTLAELGVSENDSRRWQSIASVPEPVFESHLAETQAVGRELTTAGVLAIARNGGMAVHYSSEADDWSTPEDLFRLLDEEFRFDLDVCATAANAKCGRFFGPDCDGLVQDWMGTCWMNPPYGDEISRWVAKAFFSSERDATVVCLVPARVDTSWWWDYCRYGEIRFLKGRLRFSGTPNSAPFPSAVVIFPREPRVVWWEAWKA